MKEFCKVIHTCNRACSWAIEDHLLWICFHPTRHGSEQDGLYPFKKTTTITIIFSIIIIISTRQQLNKTSTAKENLHKAGVEFTLPEFPHGYKDRSQTLLDGRSWYPLPSLQFKERLFQPRLSSHKIWRNINYFFTLININYFRN